MDIPINILYFHISDNNKPKLSKKFIIYTKSIADKKMDWQSGVRNIQIKLPTSFVCGGWLHGIEKSKMTDIELLQRQFEEAEKQYTNLRHTIVQRSKEGLDPEINTLEYEYGNIDPDADYYVHCWGKHIDREPNEKGHPSWHFLSRPSPQGWSVRQAEGRALSLAREASKCLIGLPELEGLMIDDSAERWFFALHRIYACTKWAYDPPPSEFHPTIPRLKLSGSWREAKPGEAYIEELDNVFLKSAMLCGSILASKQKSAGKEQNSIPAKIWAMFCKLYEITLKVVVDAVLDKMCPK